MKCEGGYVRYDVYMTTAGVITSVSNGFTAVNWTKLFCFNQNQANITNVYLSGRILDKRIFVKLLFHFPDSHSGCFPQNPPLHDGESDKAHE